MKQELLKDLEESTVGNKIRKQRLLKSTSQQELADYIGVAYGTMDTYEFNKSFPSPKKLKKIAEYLNVPIEYFFDNYYEFIFGDYGEKIKNWRGKNNLTLKEAAKIIGVHERTFRLWENEVKYPDRKFYLKLFKVIK